jgi:hypothetical protein
VVVHQVVEDNRSPALWLDLSRRATVATARTSAPLLTAVPTGPRPVLAIRHAHGACAAACEPVSTTVCWYYVATATSSGGSAHRLLPPLSSYKSPQCAVPPRGGPQQSLCGGCERSGRTDGDLPAALAVSPVGEWRVVSCQGAKEYTKAGGPPGVTLQSTVRCVLTALRCRSLVVRRRSCATAGGNELVCCMP